MTTACHVCGASPADGITALQRQNCPGKPGIWACAAHNDRIKCAIAGCGRTRARSGAGYQEWMCAEHWRRYCPPRSMRRRIYHRFFRDAKRHGWTDERARAFWRFWDAIVASAQARHAAGAPSIDMREINMLFGWNDA